MELPGRQTWKAGQSECMKLGGNLVSVTNGETVEFLTQLQTRARALWTGATDEGTNGVFTNVNGDPFNNSMFDQNQPDEKLPVRCVFLRYPIDVQRPRLLHDDDCLAEYTIMCERQ